MADGFADDSVDPRASRQLVRAVKMLHVVEGDLAGGSGRGNGRVVGERASFAQCKDSRGQTEFTHGGGDKVLGIPRQAQEADAVVDAACFSSDLHSSNACVCRRIHLSRQIWGALKVMEGKHDTRRHGVSPNGLSREFLQGLHFQIAPLATGFASLGQPVEFAVHTAGKLASAFAPATGGEKCSIPKLAFSEPAEESSTFGIAAQPIQAQFDVAGLPQAGANQFRHFGRGGSCRDRTNPR